jgi:hypothetical protein
MREKLVKIELTPEQKEQVKKATGKDVPEVELKVEDLEARVAPGINLGN